jgi:hypothetical protein
MTSKANTQPFPLSWVDRFIDWLEGFPGPAWTAYLGFYLLLVSLSHLAEWSFGRFPWGSFETGLFINQLFSGEVLFFMSYLNRDAAQALESFCPLLNVSDEELARLKYRLSHQPAKPVLILTLAGFILGAYSFFSVEQFAGETVSLNLFWIYGALGFAIPTAFALVFCYRIVIQLRTVNRLYATAPELDLFNLEPVYALSAHTAKTGVIFLFLVYSNLLLSPGSIMVTTTLVTAIAISILSFAAFVLPLRGVNRRLVSEKKAMLREVHARIKLAFNQLEQMLDQRALQGMPEMEKAIASLQHQKVFIDKIPTWPWQPATMRGFISAMLLPILIWIVQQVLARILAL